MSGSDGREGGLTRKQLLGSGASAAAAALLAQGVGVGSALGAAKGGPKDVAGMNIILILTDQERAIQHFPKNWLRQNLPGMRRLRQHGISFERAFTNACMCSPARSTLMSGFFPAQHGVKYTLEEDMPVAEYPLQAELPRPPELPNLATVMRAAGYNVIYKGKWHCSKPAIEGKAEPSDLERYGFTRWNPPDAGANQTVPEAGGGFIDNDGRFMESTGSPESGSEGVMQYLSSTAAKQQPFFMVISLVNPHDVLFYPSKTFTEAGYDKSWLEGDIEVPETNEEDLSTKPTVQEQFLKIFNLTGKPRTEKEKRAYLNYYGNLMRSSDNYIVNVLDKLEETGLYDDTLIVRTADHGEMGLTHGGMRQKNFNFYEEATRVPLVYSNPKLYPKPLSTDALVSHVDFLPTLASLAAAPKKARANWQGEDYSKLVLQPKTAKPVQDYVVFTYDDVQSGQNNPPYPKPPNHIISIREGRWKLAKYYAVEPKKPVPPQWEMYDLKTDPLEQHNIAHQSAKRTPKQEQELQRLKKKLAQVEKTRLRPRKAP
ncbi:MAG TPA: sulfatase-like hydrolase/transferase [Solirubrobacterales bacterium]|jgi:arylsulfatase A-like enzyme|nr:sulfatase-like hydrolase/transferase [Solirubrobacterales bacterium]